MAPAVENANDVGMKITPSALQDEMPINIDSPEALQYALLWSPSARRNQVETVDQLWRSVRNSTLSLRIHRFADIDYVR